MTFTILSTQALTASSADVSVNDTPSGTFTGSRLTVADTTPAITGGQVTITEGGNTETKRIIAVTNGTQFVIEHLTNSYTTAAIVTFKGFTNPSNPLGQTLVSGATGLMLNGSKNKAEAFWNIYAQDLLTLWKQSGILPSVLSKSANYTAVLADKGAFISCTGTFTLSLTAAATLGAGWHCYVRNDGSGFVTLDPNGTETLDGLTTQTLDPRETTMIVCDGTNFKTVSHVHFPIVIARSSNYTAAVDDLGVLFNFTTSPTLSLLAAATLGNGWYCYARNNGTGIVTIDPNGTETIDGSTTITLFPGASCVIICDGSGFYTIGRSSFPVILNKASNYTAVSSDHNAVIIGTTSWILALTAAVTLGAGWSLFLRNDGTGVITIDPNGTETIDGETTILVNPGESFRIFCDGSNFKTVGRTIRANLSDQTITNGGTLTIAHNLGKIPTNLTFALVCQTGEGGYSTGEVATDPGNRDNAAASAGYGVALWADVTNVYAQFGSAGFQILKRSATAGSAFGITNANWKLRIFAKLI